MKVWPSQIDDRVILSCIVTHNEALIHKKHPETAEALDLLNETLALINKITDEENRLLLLHLSHDSGWQGESKNVLKRWHCHRVNEKLLLRLARRERQYDVTMKMLSD